jgi:hypothetical protein
VLPSPSLAAIPGIKFFGDGSTIFYVRGGARDQNMITIDEAPVYNPTHLLGFFSTIIPDAVKDVKIYKGDFPANYGGRRSYITKLLQQFNERINDLHFSDFHLKLNYHINTNNRIFFSMYRGEAVRFPPGTIVFREKESVNGQYEEFLRGMVSETDFRGGVFDVLPGNARTNLTEGAIGYFTATQVIRDTLVIE